MHKFLVITTQVTSETDITKPALSVSGYGSIYPIIKVENSYDNAEDTAREFLAGGFRGVHIFEEVSCLTVEKATRVKDGIMEDIKL